MSDVERTISKDDDLFHSVTMTEERLYQKGYEEGARVGRVKGFQEGFKLGAQKGTAIGEEVGFYAGVAAYVIKVYQNDSAKARLVNLCQNIVTLANEFCDINPGDELLTDNLNKLKSKFKQLTSLLGLKVEFKTSDSSSTGISF